ncbi:putative glutamine-dependent NAD(+) synthetase [Smittium culicis]|uniref:NAD(+) synthase [glutamine-hydrolyzing] n=1 Tax=Smittium culicis TaxID=133412 RepID=A0A1R1XFV3_9FUNG|nr:putative glutamine-dependent NAD(+) synthetase [Smittium culicis]
MAIDGNFNELRWFTPWPNDNSIYDYELPEIITRTNNQVLTKFGQSLIETNDGCIGFEICEELFTAKPPHIDMFLSSAEIIINNSSSYFELGKLSKRVKFMKSATLKCGGIYVYGNQRGCDGDRLYFDGSPMILSNGRVLAIGMQFSLNETEVVTASVDIEEVRMYRSSISSFYNQSNSAPEFHRIFIDFDLKQSNIPQTDPVIVEYLKPEEEINLGPACWMWDYLRKANMAGGYFIPLSGGIDSCSAAIITYSMCFLILNAIQNGDEKVLSDLKRIVGLPNESTWVPKTPKEISKYFIYLRF